jgi:hypothetical protein
MTLPAKSGQRWQHRAMALTTTGGFSNLARYHWRPDLYEETDAFLRDDGPGMTTNAPRWWACHPHEWGDGRGLGIFDGDTEPVFLPGHDLSDYATDLGRPVGLAQFKLAFPPGWAAPQDFVLEVDCEREDGVIETATVMVRAGTQGPSDLHPLGDVVPLRPMPKLRAEQLGSPYAGVGLYRAVTDIRLVEPEEAPGCQCVVTADVPFLHDPQGLVLLAEAAEFVALQLVLGKAGCCLYIDPLNTFYRLYGDDSSVNLQWAKGEREPADPIKVADVPGARDFSLFWQDSRLYLRWVASGTWYRAYTDDSLNFTVTSMGTGLTHLRSWGHYGTEYVIGYDKGSGTWYCQKYDARHGQAYNFADGSTQVQIAAGDDEEAGLWGDSAGWLYVDLTSGSVITRYGSRDGGSTWQVMS